MACQVSRMHAARFQGTQGNSICHGNDVIVDASLINMKTLEEIMSVKFYESVKICPQLRENQLCEGINLAEVGEATKGLTGADLRALIHTATLEAEMELGIFNLAK